MTGTRNHRSEEKREHGIRQDTRQDMREDMTEYRA